MPIALLITMIVIAVCVIVLPPYLLWFRWWDRRVERQAVELFPDDTDEGQQGTWQLIRAVEGPRLPRLIKLDLSDFYARWHGIRPK